MPIAARMRAACRSLFRRSRVDADLEAELRDHFEQEIEDGLRAGLTCEEARRKAQRLFGPTTLVKEECREATGTRWLEDFLQDCRYGLRVLRRSPVFTTMAILSLAPGIGGGTAIFSLMDRVMFRMMPVHDPGGVWCRLRAYIRLTVRRACRIRCFKSSGRT